MTMHESDHLETVLARAMQSRPEHVPQMDLAAEAMSRAARLQASERRLIRLAYWRRVATVAATLFIGAVLVYGYLRMPASTSSDGTLSDASSTASTSVDLTTLGVCALVVTLILVVVATLLTTERPRFRLSPA